MALINVKQKEKLVEICEDFPKCYMALIAKCAQTEREIVEISHLATH